jgi:hypothetical protein
MPKGFRGFQKGNKIRLGKNSPNAGYKKGHIPWSKGKNYKWKDGLKYKILSEGNHNWKGDDIGYTALHHWVWNRIPKPEICPNCNKRKAYDLANKGIYNRDLKNWEWLCRHCHMVKDGRMNNLKQFQLKKKKKCIYCAEKPKRSPYRDFCSKKCKEDSTALKRREVLNSVRKI